MKLDRSTTYLPAESVEQIVRELSRHPWNHIDTCYPTSDYTTLCSGGYFDVPPGLKRELFASGLLAQSHGTLFTNNGHIYRLADELPEWAELIRVQAQLGEMG